MGASYPSEPGTVGDDCADDPACAGIETDCENDVDDDDDGFTDCADTDCADDPLCRDSS